MPYRNQMTVHINKDSSWLNELYDRYAPSLMGVITKIVGRPAEAEKVLYHLFIEIWERRGSFNECNQGIFSWMIKIARTLALKELRSAGNKAKDDLNVLIFSVEVERYVTGKISVIEIDEDEATAIKLLFINLYTFEEVANTLKVPPEIIKSKVRMAIKKIMDQ
jgi:RNA polymerase sigma-70 factor (ECF subfamily)